MCNKDDKEINEVETEITITLEDWHTGEMPYNARKLFYWSSYELFRKTGLGPIDAKADAKWL